MSHHFILQPSPTHDSSSLHYDGPSTAKIPRKSSSQTPTSHRRFRHSPFSSTLSTRQSSSPFITVLTGRTFQRNLSDNDTVTSGLTPKLRIDKLFSNTAEQDSKLLNLSKETGGFTPSKPMTAKPRKSLSTFGAATERVQTPTMMEKSSYSQTKSSWNTSPGSKSLFRLTSLSKSLSRSGTGFTDGSRYCSPRKMNRVEKAIVKVQDIIDGCDRIKEENVDFGKTMRLQIEQEVSNSPRSQKSPKSPGIRLTEEKEEETPKSKFTFWRTNEGFRQERTKVKEELQKQRDEEFRREELRKAAEEEAAFIGTYREVKGKKPINLSEIQESTGMTKFILQRPRLFQGTKPPSTTRRAERLLFDPPKVQDQVLETSLDPALSIQGQILVKLALRPSTSLNVAVHNRTQQESPEKQRARALLAMRKASDESSSQFEKTLSSPLIRPLRRMESGEMSPSSIRVSPILKSVRKESGEDGKMFLFRANSIEKKGTLFDLDAVKEGEDNNRPSLYNTNVFTSRKKGGPEMTNPVLKKTASMVLAETLAKVDGRKVRLEVEASDLFMSHKKGKFKGKNGSIQDVYRTPASNSRNIL